jgi:hypothetical protein
MEPEGMDLLVALIMPSPGMVTRLAAEHANDGSGRCRSCSQGAQSGRTRYPCTIRTHVDEARRRMAARKSRVS